MTSVTSPQQSDRRGTDEIPGPRGGQGVRLLVLGTDRTAQELRDRATAAGCELAQRYSARVSHVAYGSGIDPEDARYTKIRDAGLVLLPLQKCAEVLGLEAEEEPAEAVIEDIEQAAIEDVAVEDVVTEPVVLVEDTEPEAVEAPVEVETVDASEAPVDDEPLEIPPLHHADELVDELTDELAEEPVIESATDLVPGFAEDLVEEPAEFPLAAAVIGADPWLGGLGELREQDDAEDDEAAEIPVISVTADRPAAPSRKQSQDDDTGPRSGAGHVLLSLVWALIPFATFGLLTPITFGYAAYRLRSRALVLAAVLYTVAVVASFALSAARPHAAAPSNATGALLTIALAGTWIGGTLHGLSIRNRVFAR